MQDFQDTTPMPMQTAVILPVHVEQVRWLADEPALSEMLADPITQMLMHRDGVQEAEIRRLAARLRDRTAQRTGQRPGQCSDKSGRRPANDLASSQSL